MELLVSGRVRHCQMQPHQVHVALLKHLPGLIVNIPEFALERNTCKIELFCNTTSTLDYTVTLTRKTTLAPAAIALLAREADGLNPVLIKALGRRFRRAEMLYCIVEEPQNRSNMLKWVWESPLSSRPAKLSYLLTLGLLILAGILVYGELHQPASSARNLNVVSLLLAICLPALTLPLPFIFEYLKSHGGGRWLFSQIGGGPP